MSTEIQKTGLQKFNLMLENTRTQDYLTSVLGNKKDTFVSNMVALVSSNKMLSECDPSTIMFSCLKATALSLPLDANLGFCYVIPFNDRKSGKQVATFQIGKNGFVQLALRSGQFETLNVRDVREGEIVEEDFLSGEYKFKGLKENREKAKIIGYVAYFRLTNGFHKQLYMTCAELDAHGTMYSQTKRKGFGLWVDKKESMYEKTCIKRLLSKYAPLSVEMNQAIISDQGVLGENDQVRYVDNEEDAIDMDKAAEVADKFADFEEVTETKEKVDKKTGEILANKK